MKLVYSPRSLRHLKAIHDYVARDNPAAADRVTNQIRDSTSRLGWLPYSGRPGLHGTRLLSVPGLPYIVVHQVRRDHVRILGVFHTARNRRY